MSFNPLNVVAALPNKPSRVMVGKGDSAGTGNNLREDPSGRIDIAAERPQVVQDLMRDIDQHRSEMVEQPPIFDRRLKQE